MPLLRASPASVLVFCSIASLLTACQDQAGRLTGAPKPPPDISPYVTGAAAASLGADGLFVEAEPSRRERPIISRDQAAALAVAYVRSYAQFLVRSWESERGAAIRIEVLRADPRVYFADSPYGPFPEGPYHPAFRRMFGPYYVVTLTEGTDAVLLVGVSAFNADVGIDERGHVRETQLGGGEFMSAAVSRTGRTYSFLSPEQAVERVSRASGARANHAPELLLRPRYHPSLAVWKVPLERSVPVRAVASGRRRLANSLYVDGLGQTLVPADNQPDARVLNLPVGPPWEREVRRTMPARIPVTPGRAVEYEVVVVDSAA